MDTQWWASRTRRRFGMAVGLAVGLLVPGFVVLAEQGSSSSSGSVAPTVPDPLEDSVGQSSAALPPPSAMPTSEPADPTTTTVPATDNTKTMTAGAAATEVSVPGVVRFLSGAAAAEGGVVYLSWAAPLDDGGAEVVDYVVEQSIDGGGSWMTVGGVSAAPSLAVDGLVNGTAYRFRVAAVNSAGTGAFADSVEVTPEAPVSFGVSVVAVCVDGVPQASFALDGSGAVIVTFGGVPRQLQSEWPTWSAVWPSVGGVFAPEVSWNAVVAGESGAPVDSGVLALPADCEPPVSVPGVVRSLGAVPGGSGQVRLTWLAPASNGGAVVTDYVIQRSWNGTGGWVVVSDGVRATTGYTVSNLSNGTRVLVPGVGPQRGGHRSGQCRRQRRAADRAGCGAVVGRGAGRLGPGAADVVGAGVEWWGGGDRLRDPAFVERDGWMGGGERRCTRHHRLHRVESVQRHALLVPGVGPQRGRAPVRSVSPSTPSLPGDLEPHGSSRGPLTRVGRRRGNHLSKLSSSAPPSQHSADVSTAIAPSTGAFVVVVAASFVAWSVTVRQGRRFRLRSEDRARPARTRGKPDAPARTASSSLFGPARRFLSPWTHRASASRRPESAGTSK